MGYRFDMRSKSTTQQSIVKQRDEADRITEKENKKSQLEAEVIKCKPQPKNGDWESVAFYKGEKRLLELRISGTAIVNDPCNLKGINIHDWLCKTGKSFVNEVKEYEVLLITSYDIVDKKLSTSWKNLRKEKNDNQIST
ncbi:hypothetical protein ACQCU1_12575 [Sutcliffiella horikoshii]|uniref:hypothetical protein n=1 Tax=Sutcliffiella horikoshii TaxID=79883 RepID=UPI003CF5EF2C